MAAIGSSAGPPDGEWRIDGFCGWEATLTGFIRRPWRSRVPAKAAHLEPHRQSSFRSRLQNDTAGTARSAARQWARLVLDGSSRSVGTWREHLAGLDPVNIAVQPLRDRYLKLDIGSSGWTRKRSEQRERLDAGRQAAEPTTERSEGGGSPVWTTFATGQLSTLVRPGPAAREMR